jgi:high-affinity Fe2+/Pb2+ permease
MLATAIIVFREVLEAALIVGIVVAIIGYVLISRARSALQGASLAPRRTVETLKEDKAWASEQMH